MREYLLCFDGSAQNVRYTPRLVLELATQEPERRLHGTRITSHELRHSAANTVLRFRYLTKPQQLGLFLQKIQARGRGIRVPIWHAVH